MSKRPPMLFAGILGCATLIGCGTTPQLFSTQILRPDGSPLYIEDLQAIVDDDALTDEEKAQRVRDLGIEDEKLIRAILGV